MARRFLKYQTETLRKAFDESDHLTREKKIELAGSTGLDMEQVASWFNRKRVKKRARESTSELERVNTELKKSLQDCLEREGKLQMEVRGCRSRIANLQDENSRMKRRLVDNTGYDEVGVPGGDDTGDDDEVGVPGGDNTLYDLVMRFAKGAP